jgi:hypothetical protein
MYYQRLRQYLRDIVQKQNLTHILMTHKRVVLNENVIDMYNSTMFDWTSPKPKHGIKR